MATARSLVAGFRGLGVEERSGDARTAPVAYLPLTAGLPSVAAIGAFATFEDHRHVRIVLVVVDHLVEELGLELSWDHAIDHPVPIVGPAARGGRSPGRPGRPDRPARSM